MRNNYSRALAGLIASTALFFSGCGNSENFVFTNGVIAVPPAPTPPIAVNDAFSALGNATLNQSAANGVLTNDTVNGATISAFDAVGSQGGAIVLNADGSFTYTPVFGFVGAETFTYTLSNADGDSTATVTLTSTGRGFFVNNSVPDGGDGSQADPFDTLAEALNASAAGDTVFVARGNGTNTGQAGQVTLKPGVNLIGEGTGLILTQTIVPLGQAPVLQGPVVCGGNNTISGIAFENSATESININGVGDVTVDNISSDLAAEEHIDIDNATGTITISNSIFTDVGNVANSDYIDIDQDSVSAAFVITDNSFTNPMRNNADDAVEFLILGTSSNNTLTFSRNTVMGVDATDEFEQVLDVDVDQNGGSFTLTADNNVSQFTDEETIEVSSSQSNVTITGSITNNMLSDSSDEEFIDIDGNNGTFTISGNILTNGSEDGIQFGALAMGATLIVENNQTTNVSNGVAVFDGGGDVDVAIRNNTFTDSTNRSILIDNYSINICAVITGNIVNDNMEFADFGGGTLSVEQFGDSMGDILATLNTFNGGASIEVPSDPVMSVAAGACAIP